MANNNPPCEDAPCCGCCGTNLMGVNTMEAEARSVEEWLSDPDRFYDDYDEYADED